MNNLGNRERNIAIIFLIIFVCVILYVFPIRMLNNSTVELQAQKESLQAQKDYYDALAQQNEATRAEIESIEANISDLEETFLPEINAECIEQWVLSVFERNNCPYLVDARTYEVTAPDIVLPDGTLAADNVVVKSVDVTYSTTDGWNVASYNGENSIYNEQGVPDQGLLDAQMADRHYEGMYSRTGYDQFLEALVEIEGTNPDCIKVVRIASEEKGGYVLLYATINFYSATFTDRVSEPDTTAPYVSWHGMTGIATDHGFIGMPFYVDDADSAWFGVHMPDTDAADTTRPFATYYSTQTWANLVNTNGLMAALGLDENGGLATGGGAASEETPDDGNGEEIPDDDN